MKMVPAYTFTKFRLLPSEIQLKIWSLTARTEKPQTYRFLNMLRDTYLRISQSALSVLAEYSGGRLTITLPHFLSFFTSVATLER